MSKYVVDKSTNICYNMLYHHRFRFCSGQSERLSWPASPSASPGWSWPPPPPYSPFTSAGSDTGHDVDLQLRLLDLRVHKDRSLKNLMLACFSMLTPSPALVNLHTSHLQSACDTTLPNCPRFELILITKVLSFWGEEKIA